LPKVASKNAALGEGGAGFDGCGINHFSEQSVEGPNAHKKKCSKKDGRTQKSEGRP